MYGPMLRHCSLLMSCCEGVAELAAWAPTGVTRNDAATAALSRRFMLRLSRSSVRKSFLQGSVAAARKNATDDIPIIAAIWAQGHRARAASGQRHGRVARILSGGAWGAARIAAAEIRDGGAACGRLAFGSGRHVGA